MTMCKIILGEHSVDEVQLYCQTTADRAELLAHGAETAEWRVHEKPIVTGLKDSAKNMDGTRLSLTS